MPELPPNVEAVIEEVSSKIADHESAAFNILSERELFLDMYKGTNYTAYKVQSKASLSNLPSPTIAEAVETLTNTIFTMLTAYDPNFTLTSLDGRQDPSSLFKNTQLLRMQHDRTKRKKKLMAAVRSNVLNGSSFVEQPWISWPPGESNPAWEATDFIHRPLPNMFWMPKAISIDYADYIGSVDAISANRLKALAEMDQEGAAWSKFGVAIALKETESEEFTGTEVRQRLSSLGYSNMKGTKELATYYGPLDSVDGGRQEYVVGLLNRKFIVRFHKSLYPRGMRPFRFAQHIELENDPLGIGVGHQLQFQQRYINSNLNRTMDCITLATFHMLLANRYNGLKTDDMVISPMAVLEADDINGVREFGSDPQAAAQGLKLHEFLVNQARSHTGATDVLQAIVTEASAAEVKIAQSNSMRSVSNKTDLLAEEFVREAVCFDNFNNYIFLDQPIWLNAVGMQHPVMIHPIDIARNINPVPRIITDKDYTPQKIKNTLQLLQILTSIRNQIEPNSPIWGLVSELVGSLGYDPSRFTPGQMQMQPNPEAMAGLLAKESAMAQPGGNLAERFIQAQQGVNQIAAA